MAKHRMRALWVAVSIVAPSIVSVGAFLCDFDYPDGLLSSNAFARCNMDIGHSGSATLICPRRVNDTKYVWHPQPKSGDHSHLNAYVSGDGKLRAVALSDVVVTDAPVSFASVQTNLSQTKLIFSLRDDQIYAITERHSIFICGPRDLILSEKLQRHLDAMNGVIQMQALPWTSNTPLVRAIKKMGKGLGVVFLYRGYVHIPLHGCGSRPSPLFALDNEVAVDPVTGVRSCVADPMSKSRIGFVCEGRIEPDDCMRYLFDTNGDTVGAPLPDHYWNVENYRPWVVAQYVNELALPPINGECRCIDSETGQVKARIEIRSKNEYVCDITSKIFRNRVHPIRGPWCSVVLHPGSALTVRFPVAGVDSRSDEDSDSDFQAGLPSQDLSIYEYETEFLPKDLTTLRQLKSNHDMDRYDEISYHEVIAGDALEWDLSQMAQGEVKLKYHVDKPLTLRNGKNLFVYHWTLKSRNRYVLERISATVSVSFAFTHRYNIIGCDRGLQSVFNQDISDEYCSTHFTVYGTGERYECVYDGMRDVRQTGIHCEPDEELLPGNCRSTGYDLYSNQIMPFPGSIRNAVPYPIPGFQVFDFEFHNSTALSFACVCVDELGYENSRLVLEHNHHETYRYAVRREEPQHTLSPYLLLPWHEVALSNDDFTSSRPLVLYNVSSASIKLNVGTTLWLACVPDSEIISFEEMLNVGDNGGIRTTWLPKQPEVFYYTVNETAHGHVLIRKRYNDAFVTVPGSFEVRHQEVNAAGGYKMIMIELNRRAIVISKDPQHKEIVPMTFVCGKALQPSDLSIVTDNATTSASVSPPNLRTIGSSTRYSWHAVEVAVETTDPYMQGCGVTYASNELFKPEALPIYDSDGEQQPGCKFDFHAAKEAAFYCPAPYVLDPPSCFSQVAVEGTVKKTDDLSQSLVVSRSNHFVILSFDASHVGPGETLRQTPPLECRCVTVKGIVLSTIQIENYYAK
ncbi:hypothetical protein, conserved [Babesia ovata]|uniref:6-Cys domain-containing protein n=1 Tax=Babesia ovata TaxID=189622 RepID=A0A2H6KD65_9APIC|nr:uncharacterized protein BOVATA_024240 [Babesia ovata]GBE60931.1 hypothetical protein, conserved [Babesia ovata]